jgi:threonine dehydrogenase-like Zn-dependent dehydrogenase
MRAITVIPGQKNSLRLDPMPDPSADGKVLVRAIALGVCGTDLEIAQGHYGWAPPNRERLIIGHESLGRVEAAPNDSGFNRGDLVVGVVRRPDPVPCFACARNEWDMCRNGQYTERGIKQRDGYGCELYTVEPDFLIKLDPALGLNGVLLEPTSVVAKAWEQIDRIGNRTAWAPRQALVTGAGPVGLLAALLARQRGLETHVLDRVNDGPKPEIVKELGAVYHTGPIAEIGFAPEVVVECTGASQLVLDAIAHCAANGIVCLAGVSSGGRELSIDMGSINRTMVLENTVVFGTVNAAMRHYEQAARALNQADPRWLGRLVSRREPLDNFAEAFVRHPHDVKVIVQFRK